MHDWSKAKMFCLLLGWNYPWLFYDLIFDSRLVLELLFQPVWLNNLFPRFLSYLETSALVYGWSRVYACQPKPHRGWVLNLILPTLSREVKRCCTSEAIICQRSCLTSASSLSELLWVGDIKRKLEILIERALCLFVTASLNNRKQPASD